MSRVSIQAEVNPVTGYGQHFLEVFSELEKLRHYVSIRPTKVWDVPGYSIPPEVRSRFVHSTQPEEWELLISPLSKIPTPGKKTIWWTMYETTKPPVEWILNTNLASSVIVPCEWNRTNFVNNGVTVPVDIVPLGFNPKQVWASPMRMTGPCVFGAAGRLSNGKVRKGVEEVILAFKKAFHRTLDVKLIVKVHPDCQIQQDSDPRVFIFRQNWNSAQIQRYLSGLTCFVSASRGEAWGLWQLQSMVTGRPVVAAIYGGLSEFMTGGNSYSVDYKEVPSGPDYLGAGDWAKIDFDSLCHQMRKVYIDREEAKFKGSIASSNISKLTWENSTKKLCDILKAKGAI